MGLVSLTDNHPFRVVNGACRCAVAGDAWRLGVVRVLLQRCELQTHLAFAEQHPLMNPVTSSKRKSINLNLSLTDRKLRGAPLAEAFEPSTASRSLFA
jgi:hypothetical protein